MFFYTTYYGSKNGDDMEAIDSFSNVPPTPTQTYTSVAGNAVTLDNPSEFDAALLPLQVEGEVPANWVFEGVVPLELRSTEGVLIAEGYGVADWIDAHGNPIEGSVRFLGTIEVGASAVDVTQDAILLVKKNEVSDFDTPDSISVPITWNASLLDEALESGQDAPGSLPDDLSAVEAGMVDFRSCVAAGGEVAGASCTTFDGRVFMDTETEFVYQCGDGSAVSVIYSNTGIEYSENGQEFVALEQEVAASGERYSNGTIVFHAKGPEAFVEVDGEIVLSDCIQQ
ncbi:MAG: MliC family protein [Candidatus Paceibacterota bacterium]